jgi:hypothetical protein
MGLCSLSECAGKRLITFAKTGQPAVTDALIRGVRRMNESRQARGNLPAADKPCAEWPARRTDTSLGNHPRVLTQPKPAYRAVHETDQLGPSALVSVRARSAVRLGRWPHIRR